MRARSYPDQESARAGVREGEVVCAHIREYGDGRKEVVGWGVVPAVVEIDQGAGREPVRQPFGDFSENWWSAVEDQATKESKCTEV